MVTQQYDWARIARNPKYLELKHKKRRFLFSLWFGSSVYYFLLPILSGYYPDLFKIKIIGVINFGYLFILSQYVMTFCVATIATRMANSEFDRLTDELVQEVGQGGMP
jgi:uncharacterized membrane protein (DUF485 family)